MSNFVEGMEKWKNGSPNINHLLYYAKVKRWLKLFNKKTA